jgi:hypothetical protein
MNTADPPVIGGDAAASNPTLVVPRPRTNQEWIAWHARRDTVRHTITRIRSNNTAADQDTILHALGLDPDAEAELLTRWT